MIKTNRSYKPCFVCYRMTLSKYRHCTSCGGAKISKRVWARKNNGKKESYPEPWKSSVITLKDEVKRELRHQYNELVEPHKLAFYRNLSENELKQQEIDGLKEALRRISRKSKELDSLRAVVRALRSRWSVGEVVVGSPF